MSLPDLSPRGDMRSNPFLVSIRLFLLSIVVEWL
jgi:hypothetical protein